MNTSLMEENSRISKNDSVVSVKQIKFSISSEKLYFPEKKKLRSIEEFLLESKNKIKLVFPLYYFRDGR